MDKFCKKCGMTKKIGEFSIDKSRSDGKHLYCKDCRRMMEYIPNKEHKKEYQKKYYYDNKDLVRDKGQRYSVEEFKKRLFAVHGDTISVVESTYVNTQTKCDFVDKDFGLFSYSPYHLLSGCSGHKKRLLNNKKQIYLQRYGVDNPAKNREIYLKSQNSGKHQGHLPYWKTGEMIPWNRSYERKTIEYFNKNRIEFKWQIPFDMPDEKRYFCDFYLIEKDLYIETKGQKRQKSMMKWDWFHQAYPNSELWDEEKLKEMGIL